MSQIRWAVSRGSYSDYQVLAVFESKEDAERAIREFPRERVYYEEPFVEEILYFPAGDPPEVATVCVVVEEWWNDGTRTQYREDARRESEMAPTYVWPKRPQVEFIRAPIHQERGGRIVVTALNDMDLARKVYSDNRARWMIDPQNFMRSTEESE